MKKTPPKPHFPKQRTITKERTTATYSLSQSLAKWKTGKVLDSHNVPFIEVNIQHFNAQKSKEKTQASDDPMTGND